MFVTANEFNIILKFFFSLYYLMANFKGILLPPHQSQNSWHICMNKLEISENPNIEASGNHIKAKAFKRVLAK